MHDQGVPAARLTSAHTSTVRNVKIALFENIVLLLHPHVDGPYSLDVTKLELGWRIVLRDGKNAAFVQVHHLPSLQWSLENVTLGVRTCRKPLLIG